MSSAKSITFATQGQGGRYRARARKSTDPPGPPGRGQEGSDCKVLLCHAQGSGQAPLNSVLDSPILGSGPALRLLKDWKRGTAQGGAACAHTHATCERGGERGLETEGLTSPVACPTLPWWLCECGGASWLQTSASSDTQRGWAAVSFPFPGQTHGGPEKLASQKT